jgi:hypothetical protein
MHPSQELVSKQHRVGVLAGLQWMYKGKGDDSASLFKGKGE